MSDTKTVEDFYAQYEDLACAVIDDERANTHIGLEMSNADMAECVCEMMDWEYFDLFEDMAFADMYEKGADLQILAHCYIAFLRWELWLAAIQQKIGDQSFNEKAAAHSELWYLRFRDRYKGLINNEMTDHPWMN
jgi:hypothetical protein